MTIKEMTAASREDIIERLQNFCTEMDDKKCNDCLCPAFLNTAEEEERDCRMFGLRTNEQLRAAYNNVLAYEVAKLRGEPKLTINVVAHAVKKPAEDEHVPPKTGQPKPELEQVLNSRQAILEQAIQCITGHRMDDYGKPEDSFGKIAQLWTAYTGNKYTAHDVAMMLALLKVARISTGHGGADSYIDLAGYAACAGEINAKAGDDV